MAKKRVVLSFPPELTEKPLTYHLVKDYDLAINILKAKIIPGEEGSLVVELSNGSMEKIKEGLDFLVRHGVSIDPLSKRITLEEEDCIHCGSCTAVCNSGALKINGDGRLVFDRDECIVCELCVNACPMKVIKVTF